MPVLLMTVLMAMAQRGVAQEQPRVTVVVRAERPMRPSAWAVMLTAVVRELADADGTQAVDVMRSEDVKPGMRVDSVVTITLHGDCTLFGGPRVTVSGALGWVPRVHGEIRPYIHVDCGRITRMLGPRALGLQPEEREAAMAAAVAHVVEHEWVHVMTQSAAHSGHGVMQSKFSVWDLLRDEEGQGLARGR